jgi:hypothetical protein
MTTKAYHFTIEGTAAGDQVWSTTGRIECEWIDAFTVAMQRSFDDLTKGRAIYGKPGIGCRGPYDIHRLLIEREKQ